MTMTRRKLLAMAGGAGALLVVGAGAYAALPGEESLTGDPKLKFGKESCARCGMVISDDRFAAAIRESKSKENYFDDLGCMIMQARQTPPPAGASYFIRDFNGGGWLDAPSASFVKSPGIKSPMSYDVAAFATTASATDFARARSGEPKTWQDLMAGLEMRG